MEVTGDLAKNSVSSKMGGMKGSSEGDKEWLGADFQGLVEIKYRLE